MAIQVAQPEWLLTFGPIADPSQVTKAVIQYRRIIRRALAPTIQDAYHLEPYRYRTGFHIHMWAWGASLSQSAVAKAAIAAGLADGDHVHVQPVTHHGGMGYGLKMMLDPDGATDPADYLAANGGRLFHATNGFWRGPGDHPAQGGYPGALRRLACDSSCHGADRPRRARHGERWMRRSCAARDMTEAMEYARRHSDSA